VALALSATSCAELEWAPLFHEQAAPEAFSRITIRPPGEALTFFRVTIDGAPRVFVATRYERDRVAGVDLSRHFGVAVHDPIAAFEAFGYERIAAAAEGVAVEEHPSRALEIPLNLGDHHVAAGTNFPEHADEAGVEGGPYLFPKLVRPTRHDATVAAGLGLLDYEVEVGYVALRALAKGERPDHIGFIACNDFTDRDTLLRRVNTGDVASGDGFTTSKSFPGYLPVGNLFVIPRDYRAFERSLALELYVNGWLRQREKLDRAVWSFDDLVEQTWARSERTWDHRGEPVTLLPGDRSAIVARSMLLSGTPPGVVFNELQIEHKASGFFDWALFGWGSTIPENAIDNYIRDARGAGIYLHPGDEVVIRIDALGVVRSTVVR